MKNKKQSGFTIIEMVLYVAILSIVVLSLSAFLYLAYSSRIRANAIAEVEQQGNQTMSLITQNIRNSSSVINPTAGSSGSNLIISGVTNTTFNQSGNYIQITEGSNPVINISSNRVVVSGLQFQNLSRSGTSGLVRIQFTLTHLNPDNRGEYSYSKTFISTASVRP